MPINRNALIRYRTIDQCLQNRNRKWKLDDLMDACSEALYEYQGIDTGVSRRTVQADLEMMRSNKLGYEAPIVVVDKKVLYLQLKRLQHYQQSTEPTGYPGIEPGIRHAEAVQRFQSFYRFE